MREHFLDRIYGEYQAYRASVLGETNAEIFARSYEIDAVVNFYEILAEKAELLSDQILAELLQQRNILMGCYNRWLKKDDSNYNEMKAHVEAEIENLSAENWKSGNVTSENKNMTAYFLTGKEGQEYGKKRNTSAPCR